MTGTSTDQRSLWKATKFSAISCHQVTTAKPRKSRRRAIYPQHFPAFRYTHRCGVLRRMPVYDSYVLVTYIAWTLLCGMAEPRE